MRYSQVVAMCLISLDALGCAALFDRPQGASSGEPGTTRSWKIGDDGYVDPGPWTGPLAERRAGQVVFSAEPLSASSTDDEGVYQDYQLGDPLHISYFSSDSPHNLMRGLVARVVVRVVVNDTYEPRQRLGAVVDSSGGTWSKSRIAGSLADGRALTSPETSPPSSVARKFNELVVARLREGTNSVRVSVSLEREHGSNDDRVIADQTITFHVAPGAVDAYLRRYGTTLKKSPHAENKALAAPIAALVKSHPNWSKLELLGSVVDSPEWEPFRNQLGILVARRIEASVVFKKSEMKSPNDCRLVRIVVVKDVAGGSPQYGGTIDETWFPCVNADF